ncbi:type II toxin-antitoxin system VapC family toxin [Nocardiopsis sp. HNM0947]|uniref:Ribonuclease VapC n=1 Tax=Nocardiopsis coralli TaxID=2772213 RepID=A0ABR9PAS0_9ACTN|nr:type II toxin-antitoxin system VapC family toxin [Nocardiopsis coralli]MBE3000941.1 type II toxin-antitoxin system VapC family toxin [Nocardiopsis coralli]
MFVYLDTSAAIKLLKDEVESQALVDWLDEHGTDRQITSHLTRTELPRALHAAGVDPGTMDHAQEWLGRAAHVRMPAETFDAAGALAPGARLRSLDALHVAAASGLGSLVSAFVAYDKRLVEAAEAAGLTAVSPSP